MEIQVSEAVSNKKPPRLDLHAWAGLFGTPGVWVLQAVLSRAMSAESCTDHAAMSTAGRAGSMSTGSWLISSVAILSSLLFAMFATRGFLQSNAKLMSVDAEQSDGAEEISPPSERRRRTRKRLIALCSAIVGGSCTIGLLFTVLAEAFRASCRFWY